MAVEVQMPKLGATMEKGTIIEWLKEEGEQVKIGEPLLEIMTDKINIEVEATSEGVLLKKLYEADTEVPVFETIAYIGKVGEQIEPTQTNAPQPTSIQDKEEKVIPTEKVEVQTRLLPQKIRRTPAALKLARTHGVDLSKITGTGPNHRIHVRDVERYLKNQKSNITPLARSIATKTGIDVQNIKTSSPKITKDDVVKEISIKKRNVVAYKGIRKVIGERMAESSRTVPHVTLHSTIDMVKAIELRNQLLDKIQTQTGSRLSYTEILIKSVAHAMKKHPMVNASLQGNEVNIHDEINIGLAVAIPNGLVVPVIRNADQKGLSILTAESKKLASLAKSNQLTTEHLQGGTFTISNLGMYAIDSFTPIINSPETAILGVGQIQEKVVSRNGVIEARPQMTLSLSFDHRVIDGAPAAHFLTDLKEILENPYELLI